MDKKPGQRVWFKTADGERHRVTIEVWFKTADGERHLGTIDSILPQLWGGEIYLIKGPKDIGLLTISEQNIIKSNS